MFHHGTIRKYTAALLDFFNDLEIQYEDSNGNQRSKNVPIKYSSIEKIRVLDSYVTEQLTSGNVNSLPRASLALATMAKSDQRTTNKNVKIAKIQTDDTFEWMYNSVPYEFTFELTVICRGMNEASMIIEQIAPKFNPVVNIDIWDAENLDEPTRIPVKLLDIGIEQEEYEELSSNLVSVNFGLSIMGNLYPPVKSIDRIKEFKMYLNQQDGNFYTKKSILGWDVNDEGALENGDITSVQESTDNPPVVISINPTDPVQVGINTLTVIYEDKDNKYSELSFEWNVLSGSAVIDGDGDTAELNVTAAGDVEVEVTITDYHGNYNSLSTTFSV